MKKFLSFIFALLVLVPCTYFLTACGKGEGKDKVMSIDLNPSLEFVLDKNDKVVTVNALNEDGNYLLSLTVDGETVLEAFKDMSAEEAAQLFIKLTEENGFLITGNEETLTISISGDEKALLNSVKSTAEKYLQTQGIDTSKLSIAVENLKKSELVAKVKECMQEFADKEQELSKMSEEELIALIKESRKETEDLLTQDLKEAYYALRNSALENAEFQAVLDKINALTGDLNTVFASFKTHMNSFETQMTELYGKFKTLLENEEYQAKVQAWVEAKKSLLDKRIELLAEDLTAEAEDQIKSEITALETALGQAKTAMETARTSLDSAITTAKGALNTALGEVQRVIESVKNALKTFVPGIEEDINTAMATAKEDFKTNFKTEYAGHLESYWKTTPATPGE